MNKYMQEAIKMAEINCQNKFKDGGPFGAVIVKDGKIIASSRNTVFKNVDPTAHAEVNVIRQAAKILNTYDLSDCELYTNCFPCPMCLSAIIWANIKKIYYGNTKEDAEDIGFRDNYIYKMMNNLDKNEVIEFVSIERKHCLKVFEDFKDNPNLY